MYQKWDITFCLHLPRFLRLFLRHFFVFLSSFFRQPDRDYVRVLSRKSTADIVCFIRPSAAGLYPQWHIFGHPNVPKWHKIRWSVMPTTSDYDRRHTHTFPWVLLGFLYVFPNKKPLSSGFLKGYLIAFSDSHFGITGFTSFGHSISMTTSSDDVGRSATK